MKRPLRLTALVLTACCAFASTAWAGDVSVPLVEGLELDHAVRRLESANLQVAITWTAAGEPGRVRQQRPSRGERVPEGTIVALQVAHRIRVDTIVPDVVGLDELEAVAALEDLYDLELEERPVRRRRVGEVVAQDPRAGTRLPVGGVLRLAVGRAQHGRIDVPLPDVRHMALDEAEGVLLDLGLVPVPTFVRTRLGSQGRVRRQDPAPTTRVTHGARVALEVGLARGPARRVRVPSLYGLEPTEAARALDALGLAARVERLPSRFARDTVIRQNPRAGGPATAGSAVRLVVAFPAAHTHVPARVPVPQLEGLALADAFAGARQAGIQLELRRRPGGGRGTEGIVLAQRPTAHAAVPLGTLVRIEVPFGTVVPDLVGQAPDAAALRVWEAGLRLEVDGGLQGRHGVRIVAQLPEAGKVVANNSVVRVVLARRAGVGLVLVPELRGMTLADAQARLRLAGLHDQLTGPPIPDGAATRVSAQSPMPGTRVTRGSTVQVAYRISLVVSFFVLVPDLRGRSLLDAHRMLEERGLTGLASTVRGPGPKGVTGQDPAPGTRVRRGVKVRFSVRR